jgi:hypothetical protein
MSFSNRESVAHSNSLRAGSSAILLTASSDVVSEQAVVRVDLASDLSWYGATMSSANDLIGCIR